MNNRCSLNVEEAADQLLTLLMVLLMRNSDQIKASNNPLKN